MLHAGDVEGLAAMLLEDVADAVRKGPDAYTKLRRALADAPAYVLDPASIENGQETIAGLSRSPDRGPGSAAEEGHYHSHAAGMQKESRALHAAAEPLLLAPTVARILAMAGLRWPLPVVAIALVRLGGKVLLPADALGAVRAALEGRNSSIANPNDISADTEAVLPGLAVEALSEYTRVVIPRAVLDAQLTAMRLSGLASRAATAAEWAESKRAAEAVEWEAKV
jgi:hypothetical protein